MKNLFLAFALTILLASCAGSASQAPVATDSVAAAVVDSAACCTVDSTSAVADSIK